MATIAIGDIHGNREALEDLLGRLEGEVQIPDTVVFLGDYIDRGPDSRGCIDRILQFRAESPATVVTLLGNHEDSFLQVRGDFRRYSWLTIMQGLATVRSYSVAAADALAEAIQAAGPRLVFDRVSLPYQPFFEALVPGTGFGSSAGHLGSPAGPPDGPASRCRPAPGRSPSWQGRSC